MKVSRNHIVVAVMLASVALIWVWLHPQSTGPKMTSATLSTSESPVAQLDGAFAGRPERALRTSAQDLKSSNEFSVAEFVDSTTLLGVALYDWLRDHPAERNSEVLGKLLQHLLVCEGLPVSERATDRFHAGGNSGTVTIYSSDEQGHEIEYAELLAECDSYTAGMRGPMLNWITEAADQGDGWAQFLYLSFAGPYEWSWKLDPETLTEFGTRLSDYHARAMSGPLSPDSLAFLSAIHTNGYVGDPDLVLGLAYDFTRLMHQGDPLDEYWSAARYQMTEAQIQAAQLLAAEFFEECCAGETTRP